MRSPSRSIRVVVCLIIALLAAASIPAVASAGRVPDDWGWAVVRQPGASWYRLAAKDHAVSAGGKVSVKRLGRGYHKVRFARIVTDSPHVQVTPLSGVGDVCAFHGLGYSGKPLEVYVNCRNRLGQRSDVKFMVSFVEGNGYGAPVMAYLWAQDPKYPSYPPHPLYAYTWNDSDMNVTRLGVGKYRVRIKGVGWEYGNVQVSPFGQKARTCRVVKWVKDSGDLDIVVRCRDHKGQPADWQFQLLYTAGVGLKGNGGPSWAYLYADRPKAKGYRPAAGSSDSWPEGKPWVKRLGTGRYLVSLPSMPLGGSAQVTAVDDWKFCNVAGVRKAVKPQRIEVRCFKSTGKARADAKFMLSYAR